MAKLLFFITALFFSTLLFCQVDHANNDYIVTLNNDTLRGLVYNTTGSKLRFLQNDKKFKYKAYTLLGYKKGNQEYIVKLIDELPLFIRKIIVDTVSLYEVTVPLIRDSYIIEKGNIQTSIANTGIMSKSNQRTLTDSEISEFELLLSDYEDLINAIKNNCYTNYDIPEIITLYNNWTKNQKSSIPNQLLLESNKDYYNGFVVLKDYSDTIYGFLKKSEFGKKIILKDKTDLETRYSIDELEGYSINNTFYRKLTIKKDEYYREFIVGKLSLYNKIVQYHYTGGQGGPNGTYATSSSYIKTNFDLIIIKKGHVKPIKVDKKNLADIFSDNQFISDKIKEGIYTINDIETLVSIYNESNQ